jgi:hypothetical protein
MHNGPAGMLAIQITRRLARLLETGGYVLAVLGALVLLYSSIYIIRAMRSRNGAQRPQRTREKILNAAGFATIGAGLFVKTLSEVARIVGR